MNASSGNRGFPAGNPLANALVIIVGALAIGVSIVLGFFAFVVLASLLLVFAAIVALRVWWFRYRLRRAASSDGGQRSDMQPPVDVIEGEYHVVDEQQDDTRRH